MRAGLMIHGRLVWVAPPIIFVGVAPRILVCDHIHSDISTRMDNTHVCSRCKKVATRGRSTSIHKTLAYTRCRCHRFSRKNQESVAQVSCSSIHDIPEPQPDSSTNSRSVASTASHLSPATSISIHSVNQRQSIRTTTDPQITLPRIIERPSLVADLSTVVVATDLCSSGCSNLETLVTKSAQINIQSATALEKSSLPKLLPQQRCVFNTVRLLMWSRVG